MEDKQPYPRFSLLGRIGVVLTLAVIAVQVWAMVEFTRRPHPDFRIMYSAQQIYMKSVASLELLKGIGGLLPSLCLSSFAGVYYIIKGRVLAEDTILFRWLGRSWIVSILGGLLFYYMAR
jgi:hypothetical protein